jgi:hypothetical protein
MSAAIEHDGDGVWVYSDVEQVIPADALKRPAEFRRYAASFFCSMPGYMGQIRWNEYPVEPL